MKNLENYGVVEMKSKEMSEINGGLSLLGFLIALAVTVVIGLIISKKK